MKVLWLTVDWSQRCERHVEDLQKAFAPLVDVDFAVSPWIMTNKDTLNRGRLRKCYNESYDLVITDALEWHKYEEWDIVKCPIIAIIEDQHSHNTLLTLDVVRKYNITVLHKYQFRTQRERLKPDTFKHIWFPQSVNIKRFKNYNIHKEYGMLLTGTIDRSMYVQRYDILQQLRNKQYFKHIERPYDHKGVVWPINEDYAKEISKAYLSFTCGAVVEYPVMKYFEIPSCETVLYCKLTEELKKLGFMDGVNMIDVKGNYHNHILGLLKDKQRLECISKCGRELILQRHTNEIRASELLNITKRIINE